MILDRLKLEEEEAIAAMIGTPIETPDVTPVGNADQFTQEALEVGESTNIEVISFV